MKETEKSTSATAYRPVKLLEFIRKRESMSLDAFVAEHNYPVLLQQSGPTNEEEKDWEFSTVYLTDEIKEGQLSDARKVRPERGLVCPVVKQATKAFEGMINVGRAPNNDIVIDVAGISKFHAYFYRDTISGACHLTDANSKNGTYVNRNRLRPHTSTPLKDGDKICFAGQIEFTIYLPRRFYEILGIIIE